MEKLSISVLLIRIIIGIIFMVHGFNKLRDLDSWGKFMGTFGIPKTMSNIVALVEFLGGLLILLGIFTKTSSVVMIIFMLFAIFLVHKNKGFSNEKGGYEYQLLIIVCCLVLAICGGGRYKLYKY